MQKWPEYTKSQARLLRDQGKSIHFISKSLQVPKSTVHSWVPNQNIIQIKTRRDRIEWIRRVQKKGAKGSQQARQERLAEIKIRVKAEIDKINKISKFTQKIILSMLYWAEGSKYISDGVVFANTDPLMHSLFIHLLRNNYPIVESRLRARVHIHNYHDPDKVKEFWSMILNIPTTQFNKTHTKQRSKNKIFKQNLAGICYMKYNSRHLKEEILMFAQELATSHTPAIVIPQPKDLRL